MFSLRRRAADGKDDNEAQLLKLGVAKPDFQPGGDRRRVFTDPAGPPASPGTRQPETGSAPEPRR